MSNKKANATNSKEESHASILFNSLMRDSNSREFLLQLLATQQEQNENEKPKSTPVRKPKKPQYESPIALVRRRGLEQLEKARNGEQNESGKKEEPESVCSQVSISNELLKGVIAYVDVKSKNEDKSERVQAVMEAMGAVVRKTLTKDVTHVIFKDGNFETFQRCRLMGKNMLSILWLDAVCRTGRRVPERDYPALGVDYADKNLSMICDNIMHNVKTTPATPSVATRARASSATKPQSERAARRRTINVTSTTPNLDAIIATETNLMRLVSPSKPLVSKKLTYDKEEVEVKKVAPSNRKRRRTIYGPDDLMRMLESDENQPTPHIDDTINSEKDIPSNDNTAIDKTDDKVREDSEVFLPKATTAKPIATNPKPSVSAGKKLNDSKTTKLDVQVRTKAPRAPRLSKMAEKPIAKPNNVVKNDKFIVPSKNIVKTINRDKKKQNIETSGLSTTVELEATTDSEELIPRGNMRSAIKRKSSSPDEKTDSSRKSRRVNKKLVLDDNKTSKIEDSPDESTDSRKSRRVSKKLVFDNNKASKIEDSLLERSHNKAQASKLTTTRSSALGDETATATISDKLQNDRTASTEQATVDDETLSSANLSLHLTASTQPAPSFSESSLKHTSDSLNTSLPIRPIRNRRSTMQFNYSDMFKVTTPTRRKAAALPGICCTNFHRDGVQQFEAIVRKLGGFTTRNNVMAGTTHLVVGESKRTLNILRAIARGLWILKREWLQKSAKAGKWLPEEDYELTEFSPAVQTFRIQKQSFGKFECDLFSGCGPIAISPGTAPPKADLIELIELCKGTITDDYESAAIIIGKNDEHVNSAKTYVKEPWVLDSITLGRLKKTKRYIF